MEAVDRLRRAVGATNTIAEARELRAAPPPPAAPAAPGAGRPAAKSPAYAGEPEAVAKAYYVEEQGRERRYYDDYTRKALAMRATETTITTKREDLNTIKAMLDLAEGRGWRAVEVAGTAAFRREAWIEASVRGLDARGYKASDLDRQEADRRRAEHGVARDNQMRPAVAAEATRYRAGAAAGAGDPPRPKQPAAVSPRPWDRAPPPDPDQIPFPRSTPEIQRDYGAARDELSQDGRAVLRALNTRIEKSMDFLNANMKQELKVFAAEQLRDKERAEGPVVLSATQRQAYAGPTGKKAAPVPDAPAKGQPGPAPKAAPARAEVAGEPRLARGR